MSKVRSKPPPIPAFIAHGYTSSYNNTNNSKSEPPALPITSATTSIIDRESTILESITNENFNDTLMELVSQFPSPPVDKPSSSVTGNWMIDEGKVILTEEKTVGLFRKVMQEPNFSKLAISGELECLRHFMRNHNSDVIKEYIDTAIDSLAEDDPYIQESETALKSFFNKMNALPSPRLKTIQANYPGIKCNKYLLDFGIRKYDKCKIKKEYTQSFMLQNDGRFKAGISVQIVPSDIGMEAYEISVEPKEATIKKLKDLEVTVKVKVLQGSCYLQELLLIHVNHGNKIPVLIKMCSGRAEFGIPIKKLDCVETKNGSIIPRVLLLLQEHIASMDGYSTVGLFRLAPDEYELGDVKTAINAGTFTLDQCKDVNCTANLIKVWFRELPRNILWNISNEDLLMRSSTEEECLQLLEKVQQPEHDIFIWMLDLLCDVVKNESVNKMSCNNCAIVMGPNLFDTSNVDDPMQALLVSNKSSNMLSILLVHRLRSHHGYEPICS